MGDIGGVSIGFGIEPGICPWLGIPIIAAHRTRGVRRLALVPSARQSKVTKQTLALRLDYGSTSRGEKSVEDR